MYIFAPNMKFLCLTMWLEGLYTDDIDADTDPDNDRKHNCVGSLVDKPNEPKMSQFDTLNN